MSALATPVQATDHVSSRPVAHWSASAADARRRCLHCRQRRSYCSKEKPTCSRCKDAGMTCVYEGARKILVNESYLRQLEAKAKALDAASSSSSTKQGPADEDDDFTDGQPLLQPFDHLNLERPSTSFQGPASSDNFLRNVRMLYHDDDGGTSLDCWPANLWEPGALPGRTFGLRTRLPPVDMARRLFSAQHVYIGTIFAFTEPLEAFEQMLGEAYGGPPDPRDLTSCLKYAKVLLVLAFGQLYSVNQWVGFRGPPGFDYFADSLGLLPETYEEGSLEGVEALALAGYFMQNMNRRDAAFQYLGRALRMAVSLGLHLETGDADEARRERRRRVWWSVYSLDRILCVKSGNPLTIQDDDIGVALPSRLLGEPEHGAASVLRDYTQLSRILGQIHDAVYRRSAPRSGRSLMAAVQTIVRALSSWFRELPAALRFEPRSFSRESVGTLAHYYQCINMTVRPLLLHVVERRLHAIRASGPEEKERDWKTGLSQATVHVVEMGLGAAHDTVNMMAIAAQRDMVATYGYMDGEHIFSASIVLVMACAAFPANAANSMAMQTGLGLLRYLGERGNSHIGARYELLLALHAGAGRALSSTSSSSPSPPPPPSSTAPAAVPEALASFPAVDNSFLDQPLHDDSGMDLYLWEEGFACPTMDLDFDLAQRTSSAAAGNVNFSDLMYNHG
ncbi:hypothetical protein CP533_6808 [Ophiocordyceps camponoti-saundersi (nom. inval.)]|nr:hypothetical protein CP533_6808 [Ophiocordyceps camponoti-saundersi (nom. inval.)]